MYCFKNITTGSAAEGTKIYLPNEFDVICEFEINERSCKQSRFGIHLPANHRYENPRKTTQAFYKELVSVMHEMIAHDIQFSGLFLHKNPLVLKDKISKLQLLWKGNVFRDVVITVDLVPAINAPAAVKRSHYHRVSHCIAKTSRRSDVDRHADNIYLYSYALWENDVMRELPSNIRRGYMRAKSFRIAAISRPTNLANIALDDEEIIITEDYIRTYMLKSTLLTLYHEQNVKHRHRNEFDWAELIYEKLRRDVEQRYVPSFHRDAPLLKCAKDCSSSDNDKRVCCQRRLIILRICDSILMWLRKHKADLEKVDERSIRKL